MGSAERKLAGQEMPGTVVGRVRGAANMDARPAAAADPIAVRGVRHSPEAALVVGELVGSVAASDRPQVADAARRCKTEVATGEVVSGAVATDAAATDAVVLDAVVLDAIKAVVVWQAAKVPAGAVLNPPVLILEVVAARALEIVDLVVGGKADPAGDSASRVLVLGAGISVEADLAEWAEAAADSGPDLVEASQQDEEVLVGR